MNNYIVLHSRKPLTKLPEEYKRTSGFDTEEESVANAIRTHDKDLLTYVFLNEKPIAMLDRFCRVKYLIKETLCKQYWYGC